MIINTTGFAIAGLAATASSFWVAIGVLVLSNIAFPSLMSLLSKRVDVDQQGQLQGALAILFGLSQLVGPIAFTNLFAWSVRGHGVLQTPGLSMLVGSCLIALSVGLAIAYARPVAAPPASEPA